MASQIQICNLAIGRAGSQFFINSLQDPTSEARVCAAIYDTVLERVLQDFPWPFARIISALQDVGSPVAPWLYRYRYPNDCLQVKRVFPSGGVQMYGVPSKTIGTAYQVVNDTGSDAKAILSDIPSALVEYTAKVTNTALFSPAFVNAFAWAIVAEIATPLSADAKYAQAAATTYKGVLAEAAALASNENQQDPEGDCDLDAARNA